jgi:hypothetical protein
MRFSAIEDEDLAKQSNYMPSKLEILRAVQKLPKTVHKPYTTPSQMPSTKVELNDPLDDFVEHQRIQFEQLSIQRRLHVKETIHQLRLRNTRLDEEVDQSLKKIQLLKKSEEELRSLKEKDNLRITEDQTRLEDQMEKRKQKIALESQSIAHTKQHIDQKIKGTDKLDVSPVITPPIKNPPTNMPINVYLNQSATNIPKNLFVNQSAVAISNKNLIPPVETITEKSVSSYVFLVKYRPMFQKMQWNNHQYTLKILMCPLLNNRLLRLR